MGGHHSRPAQPSRKISRRLPMVPRQERIDSGKSEPCHSDFLRPDSMVRGKAVISVEIERANI